MGKRKPKLPQPPTHLQPATKKWFRQIVGEFVLEDHHLRILALACQCWDRIEAARLVLADPDPEKGGMTYLDRFGSPRPRPEIAIERNSMVTFARLMRELGLDVAGPDSRPPATPGCRR